MLPEVDDITLHILHKLSEYESLEEAGLVKVVSPSDAESNAELCISYPGAVWQDIDYRLKLMKYYGLIQSDNTPDPDIGVTYTAVSSLGRRLMLNALKKRMAYAIR